MERGHNLKLIGGPVVLTVLICTGIFLYMQADYQRFVEELGERTEVAPTPISPQEKPTTQPPEATETSATLAAQAAVIRRGRALSGITGRKGRAGTEVVRRERVRLNRTIAFDTALLESSRGKWNVWCSGGMLRYHIEHRSRRQLSRLRLITPIAFYLKRIITNLNKNAK